MTQLIVGWKALFKFRKCLLFMAVFCLLFQNVCASDKPSANQTQLIKNIKKSVVTIFTYDEEANMLSYGSGFFVSKTGDIITCYHLLEGAHKAEAKTSDGEKYAIKNIVAEDKEADIVRVSLNDEIKFS